MMVVLLPMVVSLMLNIKTDFPKAILRHLLFVLADVPVCVLPRSYDATHLIAHALFLKISHESPFILYHYVLL